MQINKGDRVAIFLPNCIENVVSIFAVLKIGGVFELIHPSTKIEKLLFILNDSRASAIVLESGQEEVYQRIIRDVPSMRGIVTCGLSRKISDDNDMFYSFSSILDRIKPASRQIEISETDIACLIYTSGSTGEPKGVVEAHANIDFATNSIITYLQNRHDDIIINTLPLSFDYGLYQLFMAFRTGGTLILETSFVFPGAVLKKIESEKVTGFPVVPTMVSLLLQLNLSKYNLRSLRYITSTGDVLHVSRIKKLREMFPWVSIFSMYGLTECKRALYLPPEEIDIHPDSVGIAIPGTEAWLEDECGNRLGPLMTGELVVKGAHVMKGYWGKEEESRKCFIHSQNADYSILHTGDLFTMDDKGFFYFISRADDLIKTRGHRVAPKEIEHVIYRMPGIREVAVMGIPDPVIGKKIKAVVVADTGNVGKKEIIAYCKENLEDFMIPDIIDLTCELPKTQSGKINRKGC
jgi:acyl-CoA synthetase (AMP-forming)/AMP-acid ligase II